MATKILYLVTQSEWGGAQKYIFDLATNLARLTNNTFRVAKGPAFGHEIIVAAGMPRAKSRGEGNGELFKRCEHKNIRTLKLKHLKRAINPLFDFLALLEIIKLIKKERPNIVHLNSSKISILGSLAIKWLKLFNLRFTIPLGFARGRHDTGYRIQDTRLIYTAHGWVFNEPLPRWQKKFYWWAEKFTAKFKDKIICVSEYDKQLALQNKICPAEKLITIHNGIKYNDLNFLEKNEAKQKLLAILNSQFAIHNIGYGIQDTRYTIIGTIANLYKTKGLNYLINAASEVVKKQPPTIFMIIGEGSERPKLEQQILDLNLENNFFLLGNLADAYQYLKAFDIFVLPSVKEGLPYTLLESLAAKLPVIATRVGGIPEIIKDRINGLLVEPANSARLADSLLELVATHNYASLQQKLINNIDLTEFSLLKMVEKTRQCYKSFY